MKKAEALTKLVDEVKNPKVEAFKGGDTVRYKKGTEFEGMTAQILDLNKDGSYNLRVGNATKISVPGASLEPVSNGPLK